MASLSKRLAAEGLGTAFLLTVIIGSGIMGERLAGGNVAIALLANSLATGCALAALIDVTALRAKIAASASLVFMAISSSGMRDEHNVSPA